MNIAWETDVSGSWKYRGTSLLLIIIQKICTIVLWDFDLLWKILWFYTKKHGPLINNSTLHGTILWIYYKNHRKLWCWTKHLWYYTDRIWSFDLLVNLKEETDFIEPQLLWNHTKSEIFVIWRIGIVYCTS